MQTAQNQKSRRRIAHAKLSVWNRFRSPIEFTNTKIKNKQQQKWKSSDTWQGRSCSNHFFFLQRLVGGKTSSPVESFRNRRFSRPSLRVKWVDISFGFKGHSSTKVACSFPLSPAARDPWPLRISLVQPGPHQTAFAWENWICMEATACRLGSPH